MEIFKDVNFCEKISKYSFNKNYLRFEFWRIESWNQWKVREICVNRNFCVTTLNKINNFFDFFCVYLID